MKAIDGIDLNGQKGVNAATPTASGDLVNKGYVDGRVLNLPPFSYTGTLAVTTGDFRFYNDTGRTLTISKVRASLGVTPAGASVIVDVRKNGTTIFTTTGNRPTITAGSNSATGVPDVTSLADGDYLTVDIIQVGSTTAGSDLTVQLAVA
jgi:hypothetical protein